MSWLLSDSPVLSHLTLHAYSGWANPKLNPNTTTGYGSNQNSECHSLRPDYNLIKKHIPGHHLDSTCQNYIVHGNTQELPPQADSSRHS